MSALLGLNRFFSVLAASFHLAAAGQDAARQLLARPWDEALETLAASPAHAQLFALQPRLQSVLRDAPFVYPTLCEIDPEGDPDLFQRTNLLTAWTRSELKGGAPDGLNRLVRELFRRAAEQIDQDPVVLRLAAQYVLGRLEPEQEDARLRLMQLATALGAGLERISDRVEEIRDESGSAALRLVDERLDLTQLPLPQRLLGREAEIAECGVLLDNGARCLTIHGPAGAGKATLARALGERIKERCAAALGLNCALYPDPLAIARRIAAWLLGPDAVALDFELIERELDSLAPDQRRSLLLIKDLHLACAGDEGQRLIGLLNRLPLRAVQLVITSATAPLGIHGEVLYPATANEALGGLDLGGALALCRTFCPSNQVTLALLARLSRALDGHPLACRALAGCLAWSGADPERFVAEVEQRAILSLDPERGRDAAEAVGQALGIVLDGLLSSPADRPLLKLIAARQEPFTIQQGQQILGADFSPLALQRLVQMGLIERVVLDQQAGALYWGAEALRLLLAGRIDELDLASLLRPD